MKIAFALIVGGFVATSAVAAASEGAGQGPGHWAWIADPIIGPKSSPPTHRHVWIPDSPAAAEAKGPGHWQWLSEIAVGPRSGPPIRRRVWVSD